MELEVIPVPVRSIKSVEANTTIAVYANNKLFVCNTNHPLPLLIKHTETIALHTRLPQPIGGDSFNGRGFMGEIKSVVICACETVPTQLLTARAVATTIANGRHFKGDLIVIRKGNRVSPAHIPDLSDLALLPMPLKIAIRGTLLEKGGTKGDGYEHVIPKSIKNIIDPCSVLPRIRERCVLRGGNHVMFTNSDSNDIKLITVGGSFLWNMLSLLSRWTSKNPLDGRKITAKFEVTLSPTPTPTPQCSIVTWNCRDMARKSFSANLRHVISVHCPDILILTETRVSINLARVICQHIQARVIKGRSRCGCIGGYVVIIFSRSIRFHLHQQEEMGTTWFIQQT